MLYTILFIYCNRNLSLSEVIKQELSKTTTPSTPVLVKPDPELCDLGWITFKTNCYYLSDDPITWNEALTRCKNLEGALARIYTTEENTFIQSTVRKRQGAKYKGYWLGGSDKREERVWEWYETRKRIGPVFWLKTGPNDYSETQDCLQLFANHNYQWDDEDCSQQRHYICKKPAKME